MTMFARCGASLAMAAALGCARNNPEFDEAVEGAASAHSANTNGTEGASAGGTQGTSATGGDDVVGATGDTGALDTGATDPTDDTGGPVDTCQLWQGECTLFAPEACPEGSKCAPVERDTGWSAQCVPLASKPLPAGAPCDSECGVHGGADACDNGLTCWQGQCAQLCHEDFVACDALTVCVWPPVNDPNFGLCRSQCDPLADDCAPRQACVPDDSGVFTCEPAGTGLQGVPCDQFVGCAPGHICVDSGKHFNCQEPQCCTELCDLDAPSCGLMYECTPLTPPNPAFPTVGYCVYVPA